MVLYDPDAKEEYLLDGRYLVQPMKRGEWIKCKDENNDPYDVTLTCSVCGFEIEIANDIYTMNYCPNCGAVMDEGGTNEQVYRCC